MKQILPDEIHTGDEIMVKRTFAGGNKEYHLGKVLTYDDEYVTLDTDPDRVLNLHPYVGMPNVTIWR